MARTVGIGIQEFEKIIAGNYFYIDKTSFIKEWWESGDDVTLINRPRRFGKTLNMSMLEQFFSVDYSNRGDLFEGLDIWKEDKYRELQGTYPVISLSFARVKEMNYATTREKICQILTNLYIKHSYLKESDVLTDADRAYFNRMLEVEIRDSDVTSALHQLSDYMQRYYGKKVIILLDEYDTPVQEAYVDGFWDEMVSFIRSLFNSTFKTNPYMARGVMTGITRVSKESVFSDLNNLKVVTTTSNEYETSFGFTEEEVFIALDECGLSGEKEKVKRWYDGFVFGEERDIYNPWSILNFLDTGNFETYWANTSSNSLVGKLVREGSKRVKTSFEALLRDETIFCPIDEQIVYNQLDRSESAIWSLLLASGYLKALSKEREELITSSNRPKYELCITNYEVKRMFFYMIRDWFSENEEDYSEFVSALLAGNKKVMNAYMKRVTLSTFSYFDTGKRPSISEPERFYHGFVLYDVMIEPKEKGKDAIILEFKVYDPDEEESLEDTVQAALSQIEEKQYEASLIARGIPAENIRKYGFAFEGKNVLIG